MEHEGREGGAQPVPDDQRRHFHAYLEPIMYLFARNIGDLTEAMQRQTVTLADRHQREQEDRIARQEEAMRRQQADFVERQEASFRQQREALEVLVCNVTAERPRDMFREISTFSGNPIEFTAWLAAVNRVREARQIPDAEAIAECAAKLVRSAREWHDRVGVGQATWAGWQTLFRSTFAPRMSMLQWYAEAVCRQLPKEPVTAYILAKAKWLRQCPEEFAEARFVPFVIRGFSNPELRAALSRNAPVTIAGLLEAVGEMEQYQPVSLTFLRPSNTAPFAHAAPAAYDRGENSRMVGRPAA